MNRLQKIASTAPPGAGVQFRPDAYGEDGLRAFLRDVLAIANAAVKGPRYIVVGMECDATGHRRAIGIDRHEFSGKPDYTAVAGAFIEPPVNVRFAAVNVDGRPVGIYEIDDCQDRPYMMRADYCETLRRGDAYQRVRNAPVKLGRRQLQLLFEQKFRDAVTDADIEIGFPGDIIHKELALATCDLSALPSSIASSKLRELLKVRRVSQNSGSTTMVARLTHARLFGADDPYVDRSSEELLGDLEKIRHDYADEDAHFLFEDRARLLQLVVFNQGDEAITDASLTLVLPKHESFHVASRPPRRCVDGRFLDRGSDELAAYPPVAFRDDAIHVTSRLGDIEPGEPIEIFTSALRLCIGAELRGRRFGLRYALHGRNLRSPVRGRLKLLFR